MYQQTKTPLVKTSSCELIETSVTNASLPTQQQVAGICKGMLYDDITSLIGLPQRIVTFGLLVAEYDLENQIHMRVEYIQTENGKLSVESVTFVQ